MIDKDYIKSCIQMIESDPSIKNNYKRYEFSRKIIDFIINNDEILNFKDTSPDGDEDAYSKEELKKNSFWYPQTGIIEAYLFIDTSILF
ncbi:hypothetical protein AA12717_3715 [Gluconacetobacter sacchari DSM 12717]|uniref:Uncharacterized protein n=1 Tax=Gluconacetobacter sacchari DSM 12717 TaxID=1307940 RepID=A0ABQ0PD32_9PROT|nr:hypothetical protein AA12717_3715 [Gluconacetobacter sacchari DSM 12717]